MLSMKPELNNLSELRVAFVESFKSVPPASAEEADEKVRDLLAQSGILEVNSQNTSRFLRDDSHSLNSQIQLAQALLFCNIFFPRLRFFLLQWSLSRLHKRFNLELWQFLQFLVLVDVKTPLYQSINRQYTTLTGSTLSRTDNEAHNYAGKNIDLDRRDALNSFNQGSLPERHVFDIASNNNEAAHQDAVETLSTLSQSRIYNLLRQALSELGEHMETVLDRSDKRQREEVLRDSCTFLRAALTVFNESHNPLFKRPQCQVVCQVAAAIFKFIALHIKLSLARSDSKSAQNSRKRRLTEIDDYDGTAEMNSTDDQPVEAALSDLLSCSSQFWNLAVDLLGFGKIMLDRSYCFSSNHLKISAFLFENCLLYITFISTGSKNEAVNSILRQIITEFTLPHRSTAIEHLEQATVFNFKPILDTCGVLQAAESNDQFRRVADLFHLLVQAVENVLYPTTLKKAITNRLFLDMLLSLAKIDDVNTRYLLCGRIVTSYAASKERGNRLPDNIMQKVSENLDEILCSKEITPVAWENMKGYLTLDVTFASTLMDRFVEKLCGLNIAKVMLKLLFSSRITNERRHQRMHSSSWINL